MGLLLCFGCGGGVDKFDLVPVSGTVYLDDSPHGPATLILNPKIGDGAPSPTVTGAVAADGKFTLTTYEEGDGAPPGEYQVTLGGAGGGGADASVDPAAMMAAAAGTSTEVVNVTIPEGGSESLDLKFKSTKKPSGRGTVLGT